jgi:hypothetical protein
MSLVGWQTVGWNPFAAQLESLQTQVSAAQTAADAASETRYAATIRSGALAPVACAAGTNTLLPLPAITTAWRPDFWSLASGVLLSSNDVQGRYSAGFCHQFADSSLVGARWTITLVRGHDLAMGPIANFGTDPRVAEFVQSSVQLTLLGEPITAGALAELALPDTGPDFEIGLFAGHNGIGSLNLTTANLSLVLFRHRNLDQI